MRRAKTPASSGVFFCPAARRHAPLERFPSYEPMIEAGTEMSNTPFVNAWP
jgi:hypothetical protein